MYVVLADPRAYTTHLKHAAKFMYPRTPRYPFKLDFGPLDLPGYNVKPLREEAYDNYLHDCYIANRYLTDEDWLYYGREEHHIEVPRQDKGLLTPCNSQYLTKYQHWVAGILQSEVLQKCCFACIPAGALPDSLDVIRRHWASKQSRIARSQSRVNHPFTNNQTTL